MATITVEKVGQQAGIDQASRLWRVHGTASLSAAEALVQSEVDSDGNYDGKPFSHLETNEVERQTWDIRAIYKVPELIIFQPGEDEIQLTFSTGGETQTLYHPVAARASGYEYYDDPAWEVFIPPGINVDSTGRIQGVEVPVRSFDFTMTMYRDDDDVSVGYLRTLYEARNTTNSEEIDIDFGVAGTPKVATFYAGELLLADASGGRINASRWQFVFNVRFSLNRNGSDGTTEVPLSELGFDNGSSSGSIKKDGHHYLWVYYIEQEIANGDDEIVIVQKPVAAFSDKIYFDSDFSALELPDGT